MRTEQSQYLRSHKQVRRRRRSGHLQVQIFRDKNNLAARGLIEIKCKNISQYVLQDVWSRAIWFKQYS